MGATDGVCDAGPALSCDAFPLASSALSPPPPPQAERATLVLSNAKQSFLLKVFMIGYSSEAALRVIADRLR
jgi:hypothetical protein